MDGEHERCGDGKKSTHGKTGTKIDFWDPGQLAVGKSIDFKSYTKHH